MKKLLFAIIVGLCSFSHLISQTHIPLLCGTEEIMKKHYEEFPTQKAQDDAFNLELSTLIKSGQINTIIDNKKIYEIPIVVHVVGDGSTIGTSNNPPDAAIMAWINYTNGVFSGSYNSGMSASSAPLPIKLILAKIDPNCNPTNGINRINASHLPKYVNGGVNTTSSTNAVTPSQITALGMWDTTKYYNIYVVKRLSSASTLLNGFAYYPGTSIDYSFMSISASTVNSQTLAHEFGHALGLRHTHEGYNSNNGNCPQNIDCTIDGDMVCDTEPMKSLYHYSISAACQTGSLNPCTNTLYSGGERNVMAYTFCFRNLFTQGQATRAIAQLLQYRSSLINSRSKNSTPIDNTTILVPACFPTSMSQQGNYNIGITSVQFGDINNYSMNYKLAQNNFYENFTENYCLGISKTNIPINSATTLTVKPGLSNPHKIKAYIDYDNNGQFDETSELILNATGISNGSFATANVIPPMNAVLNTPLRMRVIGDFSGVDITSCYTPVYGQVEDYSVIINIDNIHAKNEQQQNTHRSTFIR
ncbi:M43 family zinc metalloprotease [Chryseobacterium nematophagum]|nr:M43 family zinc metalloprotease [Chryseobacterium nematophagum]